MSAEVKEELLEEFNWEEDIITSTHRPVLAVKEKERLLADSAIFANPKRSFLVFRSSPLKLLLELPAILTWDTPTWEIRECRELPATLFFNLSRSSTLTCAEKVITFELNSPFLWKKYYPSYLGYIGIQQDHRPSRRQENLGGIRRHHSTWLNQSFRRWGYAFEGFCWERQHVC